MHVSTALTGLPTMNMHTCSQPMGRQADTLWQVQQWCPHAVLLLRLPCSTSCTNVCRSYWHEQCGYVCLCHVVLPAGHHGCAGAPLSGVQLSARAWPGAPACEADICPGARSRPQSAGHKMCQARVTADVALKGTDWLHSHRCCPWRGGGGHEFQTAQPLRAALGGRPPCQLRWGLSVVAAVYCFLHHLVAFYSWASW